MKVNDMTGRLRAYTRYNLYGWIKQHTCTMLYVYFVDQYYPYIFQHGLIFLLLVDIALPKTTNDANIMYKTVHYTTSTEHYYH